LKIFKTIIIILVFFTYVINFGRPLNKEITYSPVWVNNLDTSENEKSDPDSVIYPFHLDGTLGYISDIGKIVYSEDLLYGAVIDDKGFINYSRQNKVLVVKGIKGQFQNTIDQPGYPFFSGNRRFVISYDNNSVSEINLNGDILWEKTYGSSLSSVSARGSRVFTSTTDGFIQILDKSGESLFFEQIKSSRINVVYGGSVSGDGGYMVTITGIDPQLISIWKYSENNYHIENSWSLSSELRRHCLTGFSIDNSYAYIEAEQEFFIIDIKRMRLYSMPFSGRIQYINFQGESGLVQILGRNKDGYYLIIMEKDLNKLFYTSLKANDSSLNIYTNKLLLGIDHKIIAYNMEVM